MARRHRVAARVSSSFLSVHSLGGGEGNLAASDCSCPLPTVDIRSFKLTWNQEIRHNKDIWKAKAAKGKPQSRLRANFSICMLHSGKINNALPLMEFCVFLFRCFAS